MDNEEEVVEETLDTPEEDVEVVETEDNEEEIDWKAEAEKAKELANNYKTRAEKAEKKAKEVKPADNSSLSTADILALSRASIEQEDLDEVLDYAKYKGISIAEALNAPVLKATLSEKAEYRKSAQAVNVGTGRRASTVTSDERLVADARKGLMPENEADIARLARLRLEKKL